MQTRKKIAIISVVNDLVTDRRVDKTAHVLEEMGFVVLLVGRRLSNSPSLAERSYITERMRLLWEKGPMFYAEFNVRLFFFLLLRKADLLVSNDLDTLLPNYLIHKLKRIPIVFDSHEYFTQTPELTGRPRVQSIWKKIEKTIVPRLKSCITVNQSIAQLFEDEYHVKFKVVRNIPPRMENIHIPSRNDLRLPIDQKIIILQGSGINIQRGAEEAVMAMQFIDNALLTIVGGGDVVPLLKTMVSEKNLAEKVIFIPRLTPEKLAGYTANADIGLSIDKDTNINYHFSLPNKLFDYLNAGIAVVASPLPEIKHIIEQYECGTFIPDHEPEHIAHTINNLLNDQQRLRIYRANAKKAASEITWENEKKVLREIFEPYA